MIATRDRVDGSGLSETKENSSLPTGLTGRDNRLGYNDKDCILFASMCEKCVQHSLARSKAF